MNIRRSLLIALILLAFGALLLHLRIHPIYLKTNPDIIDKTNLFAFLFPLIDLILISALFMSPKTSAYGYLLNGIFAVYAAVLMGHLSIYEYLIKRPPLGLWIFTSTLPDIMLACADFFAGYALFHVLQLEKNNST
ncbi:hypothetical protein HY745_11705 [Candidatus Desantisbacteria bacterium]|nr:hypothetical protein [Candidatus Desantisbacteria bacterium]